LQIALTIKQLSMDFENLKYWIALKSIPGVGNITFPALVDKFVSLPAIFTAPVPQLTTIPGISKKTATAIACFKDWDKIKRELDLTYKAGIKITTYSDELYPAKLLNIYDRPAFIYVKGTLTKDEINIAMVGSRQASTYGKYTTERISRELSIKGITIVSGLARGIDAAAHRGALTAQGRTIAVMGSGLDIIYPPENKKLYAEIEQSGAVISEYSLGTPPLANNFPARNRIISGMSYGVVVVEAGEKSGSLITARLALEQGREVFAVPGSIDSAGARGTNKLIKQGAKLVENIDDILEDILPQIEKTALLAASSVENSDVIEPPIITKLTAIEKIIIDFISTNNLHIDEIIAATALSPAEALSSLMSLELKGIIQQHPGKFFTRNK
jgi:DNA processing protein